jgi:serine/threonine protein kinase
MHCFNLQCPHPQNPDGMKFCQHCGQRLRLGDRYEAFNSLGGGQSSRTFVALDVRKRFDPRCIVKGFAYRGETAEQSMERFRQEVSRLDRVSQHPQLPDLYAYFEREDQQFLVQELIDGQNLQQELQETGCFDEFQIRQVLLEVLPILQHLHTHDIVHRDVKPANLIRQVNSESLVLVDYGAAKLVTKSALLQSGTLIGSAEYAAPEQLMGQPVFASDLYGLGVTCIHLLTGLPPFELFHAPTGMWLWQSVAGAISDRLTQILNTLLQTSLRSRYSSAAEVLVALEVFPTSALGFQSHSAASQTSASHTKVQKAWQCVATLTTEADVTAIALRLDGQILASGNTQGTIQVWDVELGKLRCNISAQGQGITTLAFTPDGRIISGDRGHHLTLWDSRTGKMLQHWVGHEAIVTALAVSDDGEFFISSSQDKTIKQWDLQTGKQIHSFVGHQAGVEAIALYLPTRLLASGDAAGVVNIWHLDTNERLRALSGHAAAVSAIALSPDGQTIISGSWDMTVQVRNVNTSGLIHRLSGHLLPITSVAVHPDGKMIATGSHDTTINLWDILNGTLMNTLTGHTGAVESVVFSNDGTRLASGSQDGTIRLWQPPQLQ